MPAQDLIYAEPLQDPSTSDKYMKAIAKVADQSGINFCSTVVVTDFMTDVVLFYKSYHGGPRADEPGGCLPNFQQARAPQQQQAMRSHPSLLRPSDPFSSASCRPNRVCNEQATDDLCPGMSQVCGLASPLCTPSRPRSSAPPTTPPRLPCPAATRWTRWAQPAVLLSPPAPTPLSVLPSEHEFSPII